MERIAEVVVDVVREALRERGLTRVLVLDRPGDGRSLLLAWLAAADIPAERVDRAPPTRDALVADPATKEVVLLEGPLPGADVLPLGDLWGSLVAAGDPAATLTPLERALQDAFEHGRGLDVLTDHLNADTAATVRLRVLRAAPLLRPPIVPKLTEWTAGIDPGP